MAEHQVNLDNLPLSMFEVDCDGSACGSGPDCGLHIHPPQDGLPALGRVRMRARQRVSYGSSGGITRLVLLPA